MMTRIRMALVLGVLLPTTSLGQTPPGDRYLCYKAALAKGEDKFSAVEKTLEDQFGSLVAKVKGFRSLCNPVAPAQRPTVHQVGYKTTLAKTVPPQPKFAKSDHTAFDQFGSHPLTVVSPVELRAPSAKVPGAGGTTTVDTSGVDHFECYKAVPQKGAPKFVATPVSITDQFGTVDLTLVKLTKLCAPVNKAGEDPTAPQHPGHLVCYRAKLPKGVKFPATTVSINNSNFGPAVLVAKAIVELCVPAFKDAIPTPGPSPSPSPTATPSPTPPPTSQSCAPAVCAPPSTCMPEGECGIPCGPGDSCPALPGGLDPLTCQDGRCIWPCGAGQSCPASSLTFCRGDGQCVGTCGPNFTSCPPPYTCQGGDCVLPCGPITCDPDAGQGLCCSSAPSNGICCDRESQVCSDTQTSCETVVCPGGTTFVPAIQDCCQNSRLCGTEPGGAPADCCIFGIETCEGPSIENPIAHCAPVSPP